MKRIFLSGMFLLCGTAAVLAQDAGKQALRFGITAGGASSHVATSSFGTKNTSKSIFSFPAGIYLQADISPHVYVQPSLLYINKGGDHTKATISGDAQLYYAQLPVDILYAPSIVQQRLFIGAGPYLAYGIDGELNGETDLAYTYKAFRDNPDREQDNVLNRIDWGLDIRGGVYLTHQISLTAFADIEMNDCLHIRNSNADYFKNRTYGLSAGYTFGSRK